MWYVKLTGMAQVKFSPFQIGDIGVGLKGKYHYISITMSVKDCIPKFVCALTNQNYISNIFNSVAWVIRQWWDWGMHGGSTVLAWGFAMAPHRLCVLVDFMKLVLRNRLSARQVSNLISFPQLF